MVILDLISAALLVVYIIAENRYLPTVTFELLFAVLAMAVAVLSYLYNSFTSLTISSILFLLVVIRIIRVKRWLRNGRKSKQDNRAFVS